MVQNRPHDRAYTRRLKSAIVHKIGHERAQKYFDHLGRLFAAGISKSEFDKVCIRLIGRETLCLHNELIRSILKNACCARERPPLNGRDKLGGVQPVIGKEKSCVQSSSGLGFPPSLKKIRSTGNRDCKFRDRLSPLGPHGKTQNAASKESTPKLQSPPEMLSVGSQPPVVSVEDGEEVEQLAGSPGVQSESMVTAPRGHSLDFSVGRQTLMENSRIRKFDPESCQINSALPSTNSLKSVMDRKLEMEGIKVSVGCANLLNSVLDVYIKGLIGPAMNIARSKKQDTAPCTLIEVAPGRFVRRRGSPSIVPLSMLDLRNAAELNPQMLGQIWPVQLEKVLTRSFDRSS